MTDLTLRIVGHTLMSVDLTGDARENSDAMDVAAGAFRDLTTSLILFAEKWPTPKKRKMRKAVDTLHRVVEQLIIERRQNQTHVTDLLGLLMQAVDPATGNGMTSQTLRDEVLTMLLAGHETTANGLTWTWYLLSRYRLVASA